MFFIQIFNILTVDLILIKQLAYFNLYILLIFYNYAHTYSNNNE